MTDLKDYLALAAYPIIGIFVFDWWGARWAAEHHKMVLPTDIARKVEEIGRPLQFLRFALLFAALRAIAGSRFWSIVPIAGHVHSWHVLVLAGAIGAATMLLSRQTVAYYSRNSVYPESNEYLLRGSAALWLAVFLIGGFVEEFWRALCIVAFEQSNYNAASIILMTAVAFSIAHQSGLPSRIAPGLSNAGAEVLLGLILGVLFAWSRSLVPPYVASVLYYSANFVLTRRAASQTT